MPLFITCIYFLIMNAMPCCYGSAKLNFVAELQSQWTSLILDIKLNSSWKLYVKCQPHHPGLKTSVTCNFLLLNVNKKTFFCPLSFIFVLVICVFCSRFCSTNSQTCFLSSSLCSTSCFAKPPFIPFSCAWSLAPPPASLAYPSSPVFFPHSPSHLQLIPT